MAETRQDLIEREITRLHEEAALLERDWKRIPHLGAFIVLALPAYWIWGPTVALYAALSVPCLVATALYLVGVRRSENRTNVAELEAQLEGMRAAAHGAAADAAAADGALPEAAASE